MKNIKYYLIFCCMVLVAQATAQDAEFAFHAGAQKYIEGNVGEAKKIVSDALRYDPGNPRLTELLKKLEQKEKNQQQQNQRQQNQQEKKEQQEKQDQGKGEQSEESQEEEQRAQNQPQQGEPTEENEDPNQGDQEENQPMGSPQDMEPMKISKEKARMILDAMRNQEIQYLQQQRKKSQNPVPDNKPDW